VTNPKVLVGRMLNRTVVVLRASTQYEGGMLA
jgi:hypothetical protein